jgi:diguanylate cyclase (GGDEF)-like protein
MERFALHRMLAETDALTGVANRSSSTQKLEQLVQLAHRFGEPLSLAIIDLDGFKAVNDRYGHALGDVVLQRIGDLLRQTFRGEDVIGRWGGEEFVVGMYGMTGADAEQRLLDLLSVFTATSFAADDGTLFNVSFSAGFAEGGVDGQGLAALYRSADAALYRAKGAGRARVMAARAERAVVAAAQPLRSR